MAFYTFLSLLLGVVFLTILWIRKKYSFLKENGFLHKPPSFPFGNLTGMGSKYHLVEILQNTYSEFKGKAPVCGLYFFLSPNVMVLNLDVAKDILIRNFDSFRNRGIFFNTEDDPLTGHILAIEDQAWRNMRMKLTPTFTSGKMKMMFNTVLDVSNHMMDQLTSEHFSMEMVEVKDILAKFTTDVIGNVAFGLELNAIADPDSQFRKMGKKLFAPENNFFLKILFLTSFRDLARKLHMTLIPKDLSTFFLTNIKQTVDYRIKNNIERNDFMNLLLKMYTGENENGSTMTFNEMAAQCFIFFNAGFETSSSTSTFVLYNLALHQDIQEKLREEITTVIGKNDNKITYEGMKEMKYLQMVIDETLRMYGPVGTLLRVASKDYSVPESTLIISKGSICTIPVYCIHNDPDYYPDPKKFDPERFTEENKSQRHPLAFIPFGEGPRNCIGLRFGLMQTKIALIQLLLKFRFFTTVKTPIPMTFNTKIPVLSPPDGMWLKMEKL